MPRTFLFSFMRAGWLMRIPYENNTWRKWNYEQKQLTRHEWIKIF